VKKCSFQKEKSPLSLRKLGNHSEKCLGNPPPDTVGTLNKGYGLYYLELKALTELNKTQIAGKGIKLKINSFKALKGKYQDKGTQSELGFFVGL